MSHELLSEMDRALGLVAKATEGPWQSKNDYDYDEIIGAIDGPDDGQMHYTHVCTTHDCPEEIYNAAAIAAAVNFIRQHGHAIRAALAGAEVAGDGGNYQPSEAGDKLRQLAWAMRHRGDGYISQMLLAEWATTLDACATYIPTDQKATRPAPGRDGFVMVPVEATEAMLAAIEHWVDRAICNLSNSEDAAECAWIDALAAAPAPRPADPDFVRRIEP